jgi:signal transduction histidine kinase
MTAATLTHVFEPFFTTKEVGRGSMVQGFAAQSAGAVHISTTLGKGTTVDLWLPRAANKLTESFAVESPGPGSRRQG